MKKDRVNLVLVDSEGNTLEIPDPDDDPSYSMGEMETILLASMILKEMKMLRSGDGGALTDPIDTWSVGQIRGAFPKADEFYKECLGFLSKVHESVTKITPFMGARRCIVLNELYEQFRLMTETKKYLYVAHYTYAFDEERFSSISVIAAKADDIVQKAESGLIDPWNPTELAISLMQDLYLTIMEFIGRISAAFRADIQT